MLVLQYTHGTVVLPYTVIDNYRIQMLSSSTHLTVTGNAFYQYMHLKSNPSSHALQLLSVAKVYGTLLMNRQLMFLQSSENFNSLMQLTLGIYFYVSYRLGSKMHDQVFNKYDD